MILGIFVALISCWISFDFEWMSHWTMIDFFRILHILSLLSTSFIEEEHQPIYFFLVTFVSSLLIKKPDCFKQALLGMFLLRVARIFNQVKIASIIFHRFFQLNP